MRKFFVFAAVLLSIGILGASRLIDVNNRIRPDGLPLVVPQPRHYVKRPGRFVLPPVLKTACPAGEKIIFEYLNAELRRFALKAEPSDAKDAALRFELTDKNVPDNPEGYTLDVTDKLITVRAKTADGLFYGCVTLCNILRNLTIPEVPGCHVADYPALPNRCYTMTIQYVPSKKLEQLKKTIDVMAKFKFNRIFLEAGEAFPYKNEVFAKRKNSHTREVLQDFLDFCTARHIRIVPSLQVLSHNKWMTSHADWDKMKEGEPKSMWHSMPCIQNEEARRITVNCLREQIEFFHADMVSVAMDEIVLGPFRQCPGCRKVPAMTLLKDYMQFLRGSLQDLNVRLMFCHDSFCTTHNPKWIYGDECRKLLDPQKDVIGYWDYGEYLNESEVAPFKDFRIIGTCLTGKPLNVRKMAGMIQAKHGFGVKMTHWYFSSGGSFADFGKETPDSLGGFPQGSEYLWNCNQVYHAKLTYDGVYEMLRNLAPETVENADASRDCQPLPLERAVNSELGSSGFFPKLSDADLQELTKILAARPERYRLLTAPGGKYFGMCLSGSELEKHGRKAIRFFQGEIKFKSLNLLTAASRPYDVKSYFSIWIFRPKNRTLKKFTHPVIGAIHFTYADGQTAEVPLRYRCDLTDWGQIQGGVNMRWAVRGLDVMERYFSFGSCKVLNPRPDKVIRSMAFSTKKVDGINPAILAISLNEAGKVPDARSFAGKVYQKLYVPADPLNDPAFTLPYIDFRNGIPQNLDISCQAGLSGKLRCEVVEDAVKGKVLKITVPPAKANHPHGFVRVNLNMPFDGSKFRTAKSAVFCCKVKAAPDDLVRINEYFSTRKFGRKLTEPGGALCLSHNHPSPSITDWTKICSSFSDRWSKEGNLKDFKFANTRRLSFFFRQITEPAEIYLSSIDFLKISYDFVPDWTPAQEREQHYYKDSCKKTNRLN